MWLRKRLNRLNHWFSLREHPDPTTLAYLRGRLECLDPLLFQRLQLAKACQTTLEVGQGNLGLINRLLMQLQAHDLRNSKIELASMGYRNRPVTVEHFFQDLLGRQLDYPQEVATFKTQFNQLLERYREIESEQLGIPGYNARVLRALLTSMAQLATQLRHYSL